MAAHRGGPLGRLKAGRTLTEFGDFINRSFKKAPLQFEALGDPTRRAILEHLMRGPLTVGDLASRVPVSRPAVSQHLRVLKTARLVNDRQAGTRRIYRISPDGIGKMRAYLDTFWERALEQLKAASELPAPEETP